MQRREQGHLVRDAHGQWPHHHRRSGTGCRGHGVDDGHAQALGHQRYRKRGSLLVTSNRVIEDWGAYLGDATMASTILDRLMHRCRRL